MQKPMTPDERTRYYKDKILLMMGVGWLLRGLQKMKITPDHLSILGFGFGSVSVLFMFSRWELFLALYLMYVVCDNLDGTYARWLGKTDYRGDAFDHIADSIIAILVVTAAAIWQGEWWAYLAVLACVTNTALVFYWRVIEDWRTRGIYLIFYFLGQNALGLQVETVYVVFTILARFGGNWWALRGSNSRPTA